MRPSPPELHEVICIGVGRSIIRGLLGYSETIGDFHEALIGSEDRTPQLDDFFCRSAEFYDGHGFGKVRRIRIRTARRTGVVKSGTR